MIDIDFRKDGCAKMLSNLYPHSFVFRRVSCGSMEGLLQSLKFSDPIKQNAVCSMRGFEAKKIGWTVDWRPSQTLWWNGEAIDRHSEDYQIFLDECYDSLVNQNNNFKRSLMDTGQDKLDHSIGHTNTQETILTKGEFLSRLTTLRTGLYAKQFMEF